MRGWKASHEYKSRCGFCGKANGWHHYLCPALEKQMAEPLPLTRRIKVSKAFYAELAGYLEPTERVIITEGEIGPALVLWTLAQKRLMFYYQEPVKEPELHPGDPT